MFRPRFPLWRHHRRGLRPRSLKSVAAVTGLLMVATMAIAPAAHADARQPAGAHASITNGYVPGAGQWPWMAAVVLSTKPTTDYCGGAVVAPTRILTAAHCVYGMEPGDFQVVVGRRRLSDTAAGETVPVSRVSAFPQYFKKANGRVFNDVAVLTLSRAVSVTPATLGVETDWGSAVTAMGWGHTDHQRNIYSDDLLAVDLQLWSDQQCTSVYGEDYYPTVNFCAGGNGGHGTCHGDSGGPLMVSPDRGVSWRLIGVVSLGPRHLPRLRGTRRIRMGRGARPASLDRNRDRRAGPDDVEGQRDL